MALRKGFVDLQVNGYMGKNFSSAQLTMDDIRFVTKELLKRGTIAYVATLVTSSMEVYRHALPMLADAMEIPELAPHLIGIHIEGPFISPEDGPRGAHEKACVILPDIEKYKELQKLSRGNIVMVTLAPEMQGAAKLTEYIAKEGKARVSLGHHNAGPQAIKEACDAGASVSTHLGNGLVRMIDRHSNPLWIQLSDDRLTGMFITDGFHLPAEFIKVALRSKGISLFVITSDCVHLAGLPAGEYQWMGGTILIEKSGRIGVKGTTYLAGSGSNMLECMNFMALLNLLREKDLWKASLDNPLKLIGKKLLAKNYKGLPNIVFKKGKFFIQQ